MNELWSLVEHFSLPFLYDVLKAAIGFLFGGVVVRLYRAWSYGGWRARVLLPDGTQKPDRSIPYEKRILYERDTHELEMFLKSISSTSDERLTVDPVLEGKDIGLFEEDRSARLYVLDLSKNPPPSAPGDVR